MKATEGLLKKIGILSFEKNLVPEQILILQELLQNPAKLLELASVTPDDQASAEIVKRLRVCGLHAGKTEKLIIANTTGTPDRVHAYCPFVSTLL